MTATADSSRLASARYPTADGFVPADVISATIFEAADARDSFDAIIKRASAGGFGVAWRPAVVVGVGYGVLPPLRGEAHGTVGVVGAGVSTLPGLVGEARGEVDDDGDVLLLLMLLAA